MDRLLSGHASCPGCAVALGVRYVLQALPDNAVLVVPPSCIAVMMAPLPLASTTLPVCQTAFEATAAAATGLARAYRALGEDVHVVCLAGDGGTYDIGLQALSGAAERNEDFLYVCFDNEAYQNTGNQKSSATPRGARTTSTPRGKATAKKDIMAIMAAHGIPYAATASPAHPDDLRAKVARALGHRGTRFLLVTCPCVPGWGIGDDASLELLRLAVESRVVPLYEVEDGTRTRLTHWPAGRPVGDYLAAQTRFAHLDATEVAQMQAAVDRRWEALLDRAARPAPDTPATREEDPACTSPSPSP
jgi:pyruvate ferredoxin oxidoreductase beta subunit/2-oxoisovalerate ferredoxin oxidoreductase beta subunit